MKVSALDLTLELASGTHTSLQELAEHAADAPHADRTDTFEHGCRNEECAGSVEQTAG